MSQADPAQLKHFLDQVIVIDHLNGDCKATDFMASHGQASAISVITRAGVLGEELTPPALKARTHLSGV